MLLISVVDDHTKDAEAVCTLAEDYFRQSGTACLVRRYAGGQEFIRSPERSNIVIISVQMARLDGLETARILRKLGSEAALILVSTSKDQAISGYEVDALDYLLKPVSQAAMMRALDKAMRHVNTLSNVNLALKVAGGTASVSSNDLIYVEVFDHNLVYHTTRGEYNVRGRLSDVQAKLDSEHFILCNRSFIVNLRYVSVVGSDYLMVEGVKITVSKSRRKELAQRFSAFLGGDET